MDPKNETQPTVIINSFRLFLLQMAVIVQKKCRNIHWVRIKENNIKLSETRKTRYIRKKYIVKVLFKENLAQFK